MFVSSPIPFTGDPGTNLFGVIDVALAYPKRAMSDNIVVQWAQDLGNIVQRGILEYILEELSLWAGSHLLVVHL